MRGLIIYTFLFFFVDRASCDKTADDPLGDGPKVDPLDNPAIQDELGPKYEQTHPRFDSALKEDSSAILTDDSSTKSGPSDYLLLNSIHTKKPKAGTIGGLNEDFITRISDKAIDRAIHAMNLEFALPGESMYFKRSKVAGEDDPIHANTARKDPELVFRLRQREGGAKDDQELWTENHMPTPLSGVSVRPLAPAEATFLEVPLHSRPTNIADARDSLLQPLTHNIIFIQERSSVFQRKVGDPRAERDLEKAHAPPSLLKSGFSHSKPDHKEVQNMINDVARHLAGGGTNHPRFREKAHPLSVNNAFLTGHTHSTASLEDNAGPALSYFSARGTRHLPESDYYQHVKYNKRGESAVFFEQDEKMRKQMDQSFQFLEEKESDANAEASGGKAYPTTPPAVPFYSRQSHLSGKRYRVNTGMHPPAPPIAPPPPPPGAMKEKKMYHMAKTD